MWLAEVVRAVCLGCLLVAGAQPGLAKRIPRWWMKVAQRQGPNACVVEEVPNTGLEFWTECRYWLNRKVCGRRTRIRFECCEGFERNGNENGCTRVKPLMNLLETAESLGATKWAQYIRESGLAGELQSAAAYTLFAPTNEAFETLRGSLKSQMDAYRGNPNNPILLYHLLPIKLLSDDFQADMLAETKYSGHSVRINKYSNGMTTINCALLNRKDQHATNGVVHLISNVLDPSIGSGRNMADIILSDGRFTMLADILERSGYINVLRTMQGSGTVLAPSDEAFQKLPESRREKIINDSEARMALIQNHVIPHVICESAVTGEHRVSTVSKEKLTFSCDIDGTYVEGTKMRGNFNLGQNGVIHMIDDVLLPDRAKNLLELAESRQLFTFVELVKKAGLEETLSHTGDYTFFVPDEAAWYALDSQVLGKARRDLDLAGQLVRFHGAYGRHLTNAITDNQAIMSLNEEDPVRLQVWRRALGVEDARITEADLEAQNGVIHIINKVITPSNRSLADVLRSLPGQGFETFLAAVDRVSQEDEDGALLSLGPGDEMFYTFFVPADRAFRGVKQAMLRRFRTDEEFARQVVKQHVAVNMFPETSFEKNLVYTVNGMAGPFDVKKTQNNILKVDGEEVVSSHLCANGVIHVINKAFIPESYITSVHQRVVHEEVGDYPLPLRNSTRRTYKKTVSFAKRYNGRNRELPGVPQGSFDMIPARATGRETAKNGRRGASPSSPPTSPPADAASLTPLPSLSSPTAHDNVEETHLEGTRLEAQEDEALDDTFSRSSEELRTSYDDPETYNEPGLRDGHGSPNRHNEGSYSVREGSYSSSSYKPSLTTTTAATSTTPTSTSSSILGTREKVQSINGTRREGSSSASNTRHGYETDLDDNSSSSSSSSLSSSISTSRRQYDPDLDGNSPSTSSSSTDRRYDGRNIDGSSSSSSFTSRRQDGHDLEGESSSSSSSTSRHQYNHNLDRGSSASSSSSSTSRGQYDRDLNRNSPSSSTSRHQYDHHLDSSSSIYHRPYDHDLDRSGTSFSSRRGNPDLDVESSSTSSSFSIEHSTARTSFKTRPIPVPPSLSDRKTNSNRAFFTNYTRYSNQDRAMTQSQDRSTNLRGSIHNSEVSNPDLRESNANLRGYHHTTNTDQRKFNTELTGSDASRFNPGTGGSSSILRESTTGIRRSSTVVGGSNIDRQREVDTRVGGSSTGVGGSTGYTTSSSRTYTYNYSGGASDLEARRMQDPYAKPYGSGISPITNTPSSLTRDNTPSSTNPGGSRFNYIGHGYGQDVVGHDDQLTRGTRPSPLPYHLGTKNHGAYGENTADIRLSEGAGNVRTLEKPSGGPEGKSVYKFSKTSHVRQHLQGPHSLQPSSSIHSSNRGRTSTTIGSVRSSSSRRYDIKKTSYSYSVPVPHSRLPIPIRSADGKRSSLTPVSAHALTGDEDMYADGTELGDDKGVGTESITRQDARELRRRFRKKRHHKRRGSGKGKRRRGRRGRRNRASKKAATPKE